MLKSKKCTRTCHSSATEAAVQLIQAVSETKLTSAAVWSRDINNIRRHLGCLERIATKVSFIKYYMFILVVVKIVFDISKDQLSVQRST